MDNHSPGEQLLKDNNHLGQHQEFIIDQQNMDICGRYKGYQSHRQKQPESNDIYVQNTQEVQVKQHEKIGKKSTSINMRVNKKNKNVENKNLNCNKQGKRSKKNKSGQSRQNLFNLLQKYTDIQIQKGRDTLNKKSNVSTNHPSDRKKNNKIQAQFPINKNSKSQSKNSNKNKNKNKVKGNESEHLIKSSLFYLEQSQAANFAKCNLLAFDHVEVDDRKRSLCSNIINFNKKMNAKDINLQSKIKPGRKFTKGSVSPSIKNKDPLMNVNMKQAKLQGWDHQQDKNSNNKTIQNQNKRYDNSQYMPNHKTTKLRDRFAHQSRNSYQKGSKIEHQGQRQKSLNLQKRSSNQISINNNIGDMDSYINNICNYHYHYNQGKNKKDVKDKIYNILKFQKTLKQIRQRVDVKNRNLYTNVNLQNKKNLNQDQQCNKDKSKSSCANYFYKTTNKNQNKGQNKDQGNNSIININMCVITLPQSPGKYKIIENTRKDGNDSKLKKYHNIDSKYMSINENRKQKSNKGRWLYVNPTIPNCNSHCSISRVYNIQKTENEDGGGEQYYQKLKYQDNDLQQKQRRLQQYRKNRKYKYYKSVNQKSQLF